MYGLYILITLIIKNMTIEIGKIAPSFNLPCDDGTNIDLSELRG